MESSANDITDLDALYEMVSVLRGDTNGIEVRLIEEDSQPQRRHLFRAAFAEIESICYLYRRFALRGDHLGQVKYSPGELALLREEQYYLTDRGHADQSMARLAFSPLVLFSLRMIARAIGVAFEPAIGEEGWRQLKLSAKVRDRLAHPKAKESLTVTDDELAGLKVAREWFWNARSAAIGFVMPQS